jgi:hypothetical protein
VKIDKIKNIDKHFNLVHLGTNILSMSKRIMNEVICLAEDNRIKIYYQDTDSCHMNQKDVSKLSELFREKYNKDLIGKRLGMFHSDFASIDGKESFAIRSIFCGKKIYIDKLSNENELIAYHVRMKGVRNDCIGLTANLLYPTLDPVEFRNGLFFQRFGIDKSSIEQLFEDLFKGKPIDFDLCNSSSPSFEMNSNFSITTKKSFIRKIICP